MSGRFLGPVQWRLVGDPDGDSAKMQPAARAALGWLFNLIGPQAGVRQGVWNVDLGGGNTGSFHALAIRDPNGHCRSFVSLHVSVPETEEILGLVSIRIEPGLLCLPSRESLIFPITLTHTEQLVTWLAGEGIIIPGSAPPRMTLMVGRCVADQNFVPPVNWPDAAYEPGGVYIDLPALEVILSPSVAWLSIDLPPHLYSGGARLWAESCIAAGVKLADRVPVGCSSWYGALGLIWSEPDTGSDVPRPWAVSVSQSGVRTFPLKLNPPGERLAAMVWSGEITSLPAARLAIGYALASAKPIENAGLELLSAAAMADAYGGGGPLAHGWHWVWNDPWNPAKRLLAEAHITCTRNSLTAWYSRTSSVAISWSLVDGVYLPSAALTAGEDAEWGGSQASISIPDSGGTVTVLPPGDTITGTEATVYTWTTASGGVSHLVRLAIDIGGQTETSGDETFPSFCGFGSDSTWSGSVTTGSSGGWAVHGDGAHQERFSAILSEDRTVRSAAMSAGATWSGASSSTRRVKVQGSYYQLCSGATPVGAACNSGNSVTVQQGSWSSTITRTVRSGGGGWAGAVLLPDDAGVVIGSGHTWTLARQYTATRVPSVAWEAAVVVSVTSASGTAVFWSAPGMHVNTFYAGVINCNGSGDYSNTGNLAQGYQPASLPATYTDIQGEASLAMIGSDGAVHSLDFGDWPSLFGTEDAITPAIRSSYSGNVCVVTEPTGGWECEDPVIPEGTGPAAWALG